jgi:hypothetical protein
MTGTEEELLSILLFFSYTDSFWATSFISFPHNQTVHALKCKIHVEIL